MKFCSIDGCNRQTWARGWCEKHYRRWQIHGDPNITLLDYDRTVDQRFWNFVEFSECGCWLWTGTLKDKKYGRFSADRKMHLAYRWAYERYVGPIPDDMQIDHLCNTTRCVNWNHLRIVTSRENTLRGNSPTAINARKTHCKQGHEFTEGNIYYVRKRHRVCKECHKRRMREYNKKRNLSQVDTKNFLKPPSYNAQGPAVSQDMSY